MRTPHTDHTPRSACWLVRHLTLTYPHYNIVSFDKLDYCASLNNTRCLSGHSNFTFVRGDITSPSSVQNVLRTHAIDTVLHFAAQSHVDLSFGNSYEFTNTNVYGTHVLLDCAKDCGTLQRFVHVSTDEVYGEVAEGSDDCKESALLAPTNPYAASKAAAEMLVHSYWKSFKLPVIIVRSNNIYGPHQFPESTSPPPLPNYPSTLANQPTNQPAEVIPKFTLALERNLPLLLHGDGLHTRRYLFASDAADAFDTILHRGAIGSTYNVGSSDEVSNLQLCKMLLQHFGHDTEAAGFSVEDHVRHTVDRPFNDRRYAVDATRLRELGWRQKVSFEDGLKKTVAWYRRFGERWWGDVAEVVGSAFPVVSGGVVVVVGDGGSVELKPTKVENGAKKTTTTTTTATTTKSADTKPVRPAKQNGEKKTAEIKKSACNIGDGANATDAATPPRILSV